MKNKIRKTVLIVMTVIMSMILFGCQDKGENKGYTTIEQLQDKRIGIKQGTIYDGFSKKLFPEAQYYYFNNNTDLTAALKGHKIDGFVADDAIIDDIIRENPEVAKIGEHVFSAPVGLVFAKSEKGQKLVEMMNELIKELKESGELDRLFEKWLNYDSSTRMFDIGSLSGENGTIVLATQSGSPPFNILLNGQIAGYETEVVALFCQKYGYRLQINEMYFDGLLGSVQTGKADIAAGGISETEERAKSVNFSDAIATNYGSVAVLKQSNDSIESFFDSLMSGLKSTFIVEDRWKLFVEGMLSTLFITIASIILGTALGFIVYTNTRNNEGLLLKIVKITIWIIQGMPMVVLLMVLYYIILGKVSISGFWVSIIGFSLTFGSAVFNMLSGAVKTIDSGQRDAAFTLGYSEKKTFYRIILPQAIRFIMPSYKAEIVSLIKATAVVGYIAVQDLTKVGDQIRSRTYEAFFPLIVVTLLYFALAALISALINKIDVSSDIRRRTPEQILKGVKIDD
ncbi:MAG: transporter substrate-binding domain-containing protein [Erysipelotrichaceae bacterium]|nr:transporter substrate-binding domain-containing protein [Erysipelotrichaceae bacterium]